MYTISNRILLGCVLFLVFLINYGKGANILALMGVASPSHHLWNSVITHTLAERGHNVTILSADLPKNPSAVPKNAHYIHLEEVYKTMYYNPSAETIDINTFIGTPPHKDIPKLYEFSATNYKGVVKSKGFQQLLNYPDNFKFDLVIYDYTLGGVLPGFLHKFHYPPLVGVTAFHIPVITSDFVGGHSYPAYIPYHSLKTDTDMNFLQRLYNTFLFVAEAMYRDIVYTPEMDALMREYFPKDTPYLGDLQKRMIIALVNSHPSINYPQPLPPNIIEIGGLQNKDPKPLDKTLDEFINKSKKGAILFSLGTNMKPEDLGPVNINKILTVMEELSDYHFLWKFDESFIKRKLPTNILIRTLFPQKDILAHPKCKLFVTHAGGLSTQEATWWGVPMVGIPLFVDQHRNLHKALLAGVAVKVDYLTLTENGLKSAIMEVLTNKKYAERMKTRSERLRDRPMKPLDTALWWIEYVLRDPNPIHLQSPTLQLGFFKANSFDVLTFVAVILILCCLIVYKIVRMLLDCLRKSKTTLPEKSDKKYK